MYFLCMKIHDRNNEIPLMSEHSECMSDLMIMVQQTTNLLTRKKNWDKRVIDNNFNEHHLTNAAIKVMHGEITDFEWKFLDKYDRMVRCYITSNI